MSDAHHPSVTDTAVLGRSLSSAGRGRISGHGFHPVLSNGSSSGKTDPVSDLPSVGSKLGKYQLTAQLGRGGTSMVFKAVHLKLDITVAVKVMLREWLENDPEALVRLQTEARLLARLNHKHIIRLWDLEDETRTPYLIMEFAEGGSLAARLRQSGRVPQDQAVGIVLQVIDALNAANQLGVVHRDIKPDNILLTRDGEAKLADFGLAVAGQRVAQKSSSLTPTQQPAHFAGTAGYLAPEQIRRPDAVDFRADMYSLGATLYHAVVGRLPFEGPRMQVILKHLKEMPEPPHLVITEIEPALSDVILKMMAKEPRERYASYEELAAALRGLQWQVPDFVQVEPPNFTDLDSPENPAPDAGTLPGWLT